MRLGEASRPTCSPADASKVVDWVQRVVRAATPILGVGGFQAPNGTAIRAVAGLGIRTVYGEPGRAIHRTRPCLVSLVCMPENKQQARCKELLQALLGTRLAPYQLPVPSHSGC